MVIVQIPKKGILTDVILCEDGFLRIQNYKWFINNCGYAATGGRGKDYILMHRLIMGLKPRGGMVIDHLNRNRLDNRISNLRITTQSENLKNKNFYKNSILGFKGVDQRSANRFRARIRVNKKIILLGTFNTAREAALAFDKAALEYIGPFAYLNFPVESMRGI